MLREARPPDVGLKKKRNTKQEAACPHGMWLMSVGMGCYESTTSDPNSAEPSPVLAHFSFSGVVRPRIYRVDERILAPVSSYDSGTRCWLPAIANTGLGIQEQLQGKAHDNKVHLRC